MAASLSTWYHAQYASWNRTRRLQTAPFLATENTGPAAAAARLGVGDTLILNMNDVTQLMASNPGLIPEAPKKPDTLFGPGVGIITAGPDWTDTSAQRCKDELTPDVVKNWVSKSKETTQPTTTLQALVNLKRPSIKLSPLSNADESDDAVHHQAHGLEFEFDCDAPKCDIKIHARGPGDTENMLVFESVMDGGFGKILKYDQGAVLELSQFEHKAEENKAAQAIGSTTTPNAASNAAPNTPADSNTANARNRRRFSNFPFRKRANVSQRVSGPALPVVDADSPSVPPTEDAARSPVEVEAKGKEEGGVKVTIRLESLDDDSKPLSSANSQLTYLHIVRVGGSNGEGTEDDRRAWVVKVVKREATIGVHTFHLHEIYGLSSSSSAAATTQSYPPTVPTEDQTSECLLCLSSPREVVLLPCRHLVACKECAVNMVEFGAGGSLVHPEAEPAATAPTAAPGEAAGEGTATAAGEASAGTPTATTAPTQPAPTRRKRKAKGWYCPVCRQPYTSLLRITTTPPEKDAERPSASQENLTGNVTPANNGTTAPPSINTQVTQASSEGRGGLLSRPGFLRALSRPNNRSAATAATGSDMV